MIAKVNVQTTRTPLTRDNIKADYRIATQSLVCVG